MKKKLISLLCLFMLTACATTAQRLQQGQSNFSDGNYVQAFEQLQPLAEKNNADAQYAIGYMYYYGKGTQKDIIQAQKWIRAAASQGQPQAMKAMRLLSNEASEILLYYPDAIL